MGGLSPSRAGQEGEEQEQLVPFPQVKIPCMMPSPRQKGAQLPWQARSVTGTSPVSCKRRGMESKRFE